MQQIIEEAKALQERIVEDRRWLHQHPELGFELPETVAYVRGRLEDMGYEVTEPCEGGLLTQIGDPVAGSCVLLRADMDALPVVEETGLAFASTNGNMHACGHDTHTAMLLGTAQILKNHESELKGCVKLLFQPDEEGCAPVDTTGGDEVLAAGVLEDPKVDAVASLHIMTPDFASGAVVTRPGTIFSSIDDIDIQIQGRGAHGSTPNMGIDPINIACHIYQGVQNYIARELDPTQVCVATFGKIEAGRAANVIPDTAHMLGTLRTQSAEVRSRLQGARDGYVRGHRPRLRRHRDRLVPARRAQHLQRPRAHRGARGVRDRAFRPGHGTGDGEALPRYGRPRRALASLPHHVLRARRAGRGHHGLRHASSRRAVRRGRVLARYGAFGE